MLAYGFQTYNEGNKRNIFGNLSSVDKVKVIWIERKELRWIEKNRRGKNPDENYKVLENVLDKPYSTYELSTAQSHGGKSKEMEEEEEY